MKVGSLFAEIGFKIDESGLDKFSNALKSFQKTIKSGLKDLKEYAKAAKEISTSMRNAYMPTTEEARARYRAETRKLSAQARLISIKAKQYKQDSDTKAKNAESKAKQVAMKEKGINGISHNVSMGKFSKSLAFIASLLGGKVFTAIGSLFHAPGMILGRIADTIVSGIWKAATWLGKTFMQGIRLGLAYRDYRAFTGRSARGLSNLMYASLGTTNMRPEDIMRDAASMEKSYWDMFLGGGNPRAWQMIGLRPTGIGDVDLRNILGAISGIGQKGLQRKMLEEFGLSEDYLILLEEFQKEDPTKHFEELMDMVQDSIDAYSEANKQIRLFGYQIDMAKASLVKALVESGLIDTLKKLGPMIDASLVRAFELLGKTLPPVLEKLNFWLAQKLGIVSKEDQEKLDKIKAAESFVRAERRILEMDQQKSIFQKLNLGDWLGTGISAYLPHFFNMLMSNNPKDYLFSPININVNTIEEADSLYSRIEAERVGMYGKYQHSEKNVTSSSVDTTM